MPWNSWKSLGSKVSRTFCVDCLTGIVKVAEQLLFWFKLHSGETVGNRQLLVALQKKSECFGTLTEALYYSDGVIYVLYNEVQCCVLLFSLCLVMWKNFIVTHSN